MRTQELRNLNAEELVRKLDQLRAEYASAYEAVHLGKEKNSSRLRALRQDIARTATILQEKEK